MLGILVHGNNHFILSGPMPDEAVALALARHWSIIQIGETKSSSFGQWEIRSKNFGRIWNGLSSSRETVNLLKEWWNCLESFLLAV